MISASAPDGKATTGVPHASASIATSDPVSGTRLGTSRHRAALSSRRLRAKPDRTDKTAVAIELRRDLLAKVALVRLVWEYGAGEQQRPVGFRCGIDGEVKALLWADPAETQGEPTFGVARGETLGGHAVSNRRQQHGTYGKSAVLRG